MATSVNPNEPDSSEPKVPNQHITHEFSFTSDADGAKLVGQITDAIKYVGDKWAGASTTSRWVVAICPLLLGAALITAITLLVWFNKVSLEAGGFLLGTMVTGAIAIARDYIRKP